MPNKNKETEQTLFLEQMRTAVSYSAINLGSFAFASNKHVASLQRCRDLPCNLYSRFLLSCINDNIVKKRSKLACFLISANSRLVFETPRCEFIRVDCYGDNRVCASVWLVRCKLVLAWLNFRAPKG